MMGVEIYVFEASGQDPGLNFCLTRFIFSKIKKIWAFFGKNDYAYF